MAQFFHVVISLVGDDAKVIKDNDAIDRMFEWVQKSIMFFNPGIQYMAHYFLNGAPIVLGKKKNVVCAPEWCKTFVVDVEELKCAVISYAESVEKREGVQDVFILVRPSCLSQPFGLMQRAVDIFVHTKKPSVSANRLQDIGWREVDDCGSWKQVDRRSVLFVNGMLNVFGFSQIDEAFNHTTEHSVVEIECSDVLGEPTVSHEKEKCILIGSGLDLDGRNLGAQIDAGFFGKVFRVNKLYGRSYDVGVRVDGFFSFGAGHFLDVKALQEYGRVFPYGEMVYTPTSETVSPAYKEIIEMYPPFKKHPSTGFHALHELLQRGYLPFVIGYGFKDGKRLREDKVYYDGAKDYDKHAHDFSHEDELLLRFAEEGRIVLL